MGFAISSIQVRPVPECRHLPIWAINLMSSELIQQFIEHMCANECTPVNPKDIRADDKRNYFQIIGDKPGRKRGAYRLKIDGDMGIGWFVDYKTSELVKWHSKSNRKFTPDERAAWKKRVDSERAIKDKEQAELYRITAIKAKRLWDSAARTGTTEYLTRKQIDLYGARIMRGLVVVAAFKEGKVSTLQFIAGNGDKRFLKDGEKSGAYFPLANRGEDLSRMILCEGYSTGCSIRAATGLPVVVAFDAGNISAVSKILRAKYPESEVIFAADNDAWNLAPKFKPKDIDIKELPHDSPFWDEWREAGHLHNTGLVSAQQAAVSIGGARVVVPRFKDTSTFPTDMNDLFVLEGIETVKKLFISPEATSSDDTTQDEPQEITQEEFESYHIDLPDDENDAAQIQLYTSSPAKRVEDTNWKAKLSFKENGGLKGNSIQNALLFLENEKSINNLFCWDEFSSEKMVYQCPPWANAAKFKAHPLTDNDVTYLAGHMERFGFNMGTAVLGSALDAAVKNNPRNPAQEYFNGLKWDGIKRLDTWLQDYCGAIKEDASYVTAIGRKWLCAAVKRVFEPGAKFDHMLVLEGTQGIGKSTILKELATIHGHPYFDDTVSVSDISDPRTVPKFQGVLIIEIAELAGIKRQDVDKLKQAITTTSDKIVRKYQNEATSYPRKFVLAGTINPLDGYLSDPTGNRRFWPVSALKMDVAGLAKIKEQLWAEAFIAVREGEDLYLGNVLSNVASDVASSRMVEHPWFADLKKLTYGKHMLDKEDIWNYLEIKDRTKRTPAANAEISKIMTRIGYKNKQVMSGGDREYRWVRDMKEEEIPLDPR